jgi:hypothetical protein
MPSPPLIQEKVRDNGGLWLWGTFALKNGPLFTKNWFTHSKTGVNNIN